MKQLSCGRMLTASVLSLFICLYTIQPACAAESEGIPFVVLSYYNASLFAGESLSISAYSSAKAALRFTSSQPRIASIDSEGLITAHQPGHCRITVQTPDAKASCRITVKKVRLSVSTRQISLQHGETYQLKVRYSGKDTLQFSSRESQVATVTPQGLVTAHSTGKATIVIQADGKQLRCRVKVK